MKTPKSLWSAMRQYRHNNDNSPSLFDPREGFVTAFEAEKTIELVARLQAKNKALRELVERTCGDGCHCIKENNGECALAVLDGSSDA